VRNKRHVDICTLIFASAAVRPASASATGLASASTLAFASTLRAVCKVLMAGRARFEAVVLTSGGVNCHGSSPLEHAPARPEAGRGGSSPIPRRAGSDRVRALGVKVPRLRELRRALPRLRRGAPRQQRAAPCRFSLCDLRLSVKQETDASLKCGGGTRCVRLVRGRGTRRVRLVRGGAAVGARGVAPADAPAPPRRPAPPPLLQPRAVLIGHASALPRTNRTHLVPPPY